MLAGVFLVFAVFWETSIEIVSLWSTHSAYNYAFLVLPISLYVLFERRGRLAQLSPRPFYWGLIAVAGMVFAWFLADTVDIALGRHVALVGIVQALLLTALGWRFFYACLFPFMFLWLMVPTGDFMLPVLQKMAMDLTVIGMKMTGIPFFYEGFLIETPTGTYTIAPGCAGLNFLLAGAAFALLYGNLQYRSWVKRVLCFAVMIAVSIISNGIRIVGIIVLAHVTDREIDIIDDHILYGWGFFAIILLALIWFGMRFQDPPDDQGGWPAQGLAAGTLRQVGTAAAVVIVLSAVVPATAAGMREDPNKSWTVNLSLPASYGNWDAKPLPNGWRVYAPLADNVGGRRYVREGAAVDVAVSYFWRQIGKREVVGTGNRIYDGDVWNLMGSRVRSVQLSGETLQVIESRIQSGPRQRLVWHLYWVDNVFLTSRVRAKLLQAKVNFTGGDERAALVAFATDADDGAAERLTQFVAAYPSLETVLTSAKASPNK